jgi:membrane fusion protein
MSSIDFDDEMAEPKTDLQPATVSGPVAVVRGTLVTADTVQSSRIGHTIDLRQNRTMLILAGLAVASVCVLFAGLWLGRFSKTESVRGIVSATRGFARLDAPKAGLIKQIYVKQGDQVTAGMPIYLMAMSEATSGGESAVASEVKSLTQSRANQVAEMERAAAFLKGASEQESALKRDQTALLAAIEDQEKSIQEALSEARGKVQSVRDMVAKGYATRNVLDTYERTQFDYERQLTEVRLRRVEYTRQDTEKKRDFAILVADKESQRANAAGQISTIDARLALLKTESALEVQAQSAGQVLAVTAKVGDSVESGQFVAAIGDADAEPVIALDVPARATGLIKVGQNVVLKYDAFPFKTFGIQHGTVTSISSAAIRAPATKGDTGLSPLPVSPQSIYRVEVKPDSTEIDAYGEKKKLTLGSTLSADIIAERRRLIAWVLDPIRAMRGRG